jgi:DNA-binding PadR family transcriptional regulator
MTPAMFHIALALAGGPRHGYALMHDVELLSGGAMHLGPGTLYRSLQRMRVESLIEDSPGNKTSGDERRRKYQLTAFGRETLQGEAQRLAALVAVAVQQGIVHPPTTETSTGVAR